MGQEGEGHDLFTRRRRKCFSLGVKKGESCPNPELQYGFKIVGYRGYEYKIRFQQYFDTIVEIEQPLE